MPFWAWVAKTNPRPYLRACDDNASVLRVHAVNPFAGAIVCFIIHRQQTAQRSCAGQVAFDPREQRHRSWLTKLWRCSSDESPIMLMTDTLAR